jgi:hypothetical protein
MGFFFPYNPTAAPNILVSLVMFGWIPTVLHLFSRFSPRRAIVTSFITAWLFLPEVAMKLPGLPDYTKMTATSYGILIATFIFDTERFRTFKFGWLDLPMLTWCICPLAASLSNGLGLYDGFSAALGQTVVWGVPYFLGRIYLADLAGLRQLAIGIFTGGLFYVPLCLFETRFSPQLHRILYGGHAYADFSQSMRLGGYRPTIFMIHGLAVGAFMMAATLIGIWLWQSQAVKQFWNIPIQWLVGALFITFILIKSTGAYVLLAVGATILLVGKRFHTAVLIFAVILAVALYLYFNTATGNSFSDQIISTLSGVIEADRLQSLEFRFHNEELLADKARQQMIFGWGGWGRNLIFDATGKQLTIPDSLWILAFGQYGVVGLTSLNTAILLPIFSFFWSRYPARLWAKPEVGSAAVLAVVIVMYMVDCLVNAMVNPIYILACGGIAGVVLKPARTNQLASDRSPSIRQSLAQQK